ncbi:MAG TPA: alpha/beta fold hydrolase [Devosia sp.]|nr:alpha/beta fold hydrolase [Devosia sp.]
MLTRDKLIELMGPLPERAPLDAVVLETVQCEGYVRELVEYGGDPGERIRAYFLLPDNRQGPVPLLFAHHQHNAEFAIGKSEVVGLAGHPDQAYAAELAQRGYAVIAPDAIAFEDRNWSTPSGYAEYFELVSRLVQGKTLLAKILSDVSLGIDYALTRLEVDGGRIGFIGHSYGGRMALWAPVWDRRIGVSVSNCGCVNYKNSLRRVSGVQAEFCVPGIMQHGDIDDIVRLASPCSLLIQATTDDVWSDNAQEIYDSARESFPEGELALRIWPGEHQFTPEMRANAYAFLDQRLVK